MTTNHPANGPVSLDRLHQIREILSKAAAQSDGGNLGYAMADAVKVIEGVIAARNVETIYQVMYGECWRDITEEQYHDHVIHESPIRIVYAAPPAPVAPDECKEAPAYVKALTKDGAFIYGFNACRAAMLQAEPVSNSDELPLDYLQGHKDGLEWAAQLAEANHPQTGDWLYDDPIELARAIRKGPDMPTVQDGKSPVAPGAWIPVSERMPEAEGRYWCYVEEQNCLGKSHYQWNCSWNGERWWVESDNGGRVTHWMELPAAPQQEVK